MTELLHEEVWSTRPSRVSVDMGWFSCSLGSSDIRKSRIWLPMLGSWESPRMEGGTTRGQKGGSSVHGPIQEVVNIDAPMSLVDLLRGPLFLF